MTEKTDYVPFYLENKVTIQYTMGDILCSNIHNVPVVSHIREGSQSESLNITTGTIIWRIGDSLEDTSYDDCTVALSKPFDYVTLYMRRLIPCKMHVLTDEVLVLFYSSNISIQLSNNDSYNCDLYLTEEGRLIAIHNNHNHIYIIRDSTVSRCDEYIQIDLLSGGFIRILHNENDLNLWHSLIYCHYRILQLQQKVVQSRTSQLDTIMNTTLDVFRSIVDVYDRKKAAIIPWKPRVLTLSDEGDLYLISKTGTKCMNINDIIFTNNYETILKERNTNCKERIVVAQYQHKRKNSNDDNAKQVNLLIRFCDIATMNHFIECMMNICDSESKNRNYIENHKVLNLSSLDDMELSSNEDEIAGVCRYATLLRSSPATPMELTEQSWSVDIEKKGHELYELSLHFNAILQNPQVLTNFLYRLNPEGISFQIWSSLIAQFFPILVDSNCCAEIFTLLCEIDDAFHNRDQSDDLLTPCDADNDMNINMFEIWKEKYLKKKRRSRKYSWKDRKENGLGLICFEVFEAYILLMQKEMERGVTLQAKLRSVLDKYKEKLQFGNFSLGLNESVIAYSSATLLNTKSCGSIYITNRCFYYHAATDILIIPFSQPITSTIVNKTLHLSFTRYVILPESSKLIDLLKNTDNEEEEDKEVSIRFRIQQRVLKKDDYAALHYISSAINDFVFIHSFSKSTSNSTSVFTSLFTSSSSSQAERSKYIVYSIVNLYRIHSIATITGSLPEQLLIKQQNERITKTIRENPCAIPTEIINSIITTFNAITNPIHASNENEADQFDFVLMKREIMLLILLFTKIGDLFKRINKIIRFEVEGVSFFIFISLNLIALTNKMHLLMPFFIGKQGEEGTVKTLQEALQQRQQEKKSVQKKGIKNTMNKCKTSVNSFYSIIITINTVLLKLRAIFTWVDEDVSRVFMILLVLIGVLFYFIPSNLILLIITNVVFTIKWQDPDSFIAKYIRDLWNSIPLPAFSREQATLEEYFCD